MVEPSEQYENPQPQEYTYSYQENFNQGGDIPIKIIVTDPIERDSGVSKYIVYTVKGNDRDGPFETYRRYSDFSVLKKILVKRWPGCFVPSIPEKKAMGNMGASFIEERRKMLESFCFQMAKLTHLYYSEEFKIFLRQPSSDVEKSLTSMVDQTAEELIQKYQNNFKQLSGKEINTELVLKINSFQNYLKKIGLMLLNFKEMAKNTGKARAKFNEEFTTFTHYLLPEYEKNSLIEYVKGVEDKLLVTNSQDTTLSTIAAAMKDSFGKNSFEQFSLLLKAECNDISSFQETFAQKHYYEALKEKQEAKLKDLNLEMQKILAGKTSFTGLFSKGTKEEKVANFEKQISQVKAELDNIQLVCDIITVILGYTEIDRFKDDKQEKYYNIMSSMAKIEVEYAKGIQEYWQHLGSNFNLSQLNH